MLNNSIMSFTIELYYKPANLSVHSVSRIRVLAVE